MAYTPTNWQTGDTITAEKLNKLETGVQNEQVGPKGEDGADAPVITSVTVIVNAQGVPQSGTIAFNNGTSLPLTITVQQ